MKVGIIVFPGSNCDADCYYVTSNLLGLSTRYVWHTETDLKGLDCIILPGGFSYGDYLRPGAIASMSHIIDSIHEFAEAGKFVIGICNGFQVLTEMRLLPGALMTNKSTRFICKHVAMTVTNCETPFTTRYFNNRYVAMPVAHNEGNFYATPATVSQMQANNQIVFSYVDNPNGSVENIAGITNKNHNVLGMMPHPERCAESIFGPADGLLLFQSLMDNFKNG